MKNPYATLGLPDKAPMESVKAAYQKTMRRFLQRQQAGNPLPPETFEALSAAWEVLGTPEKKAMWDAANTSRETTDGAPAFQSVQTFPAKNPVPQDATEGGVSAPQPETAQDIFSGFDAPRDKMPNALQEGGEPTEYRFQFTGNGGEYFRIWITNLLLSIVTLGVYSAWAKVRREQYFHRNTLLDGSGFDYHGDPKAILKGRLIVWLGMVIFSLANKFGMPVMSLALAVLFAPVLPWLLLRSFMFRARNTSWRNLRFDFRSTYLKSFITFIGNLLIAFVGLVIFAAVFFKSMPLTAAANPRIFGGLVVLGFFLLLCAARWFWGVKRFQFDHISFCGLSMSASVGQSAFFGVFLRIALMLPLLFIAWALVSTLLSTLLVKFGKANGLDRNSLIFFLMVSFFLLFIIFNIFAKSFLFARTANLVWNSAQLGADIRFRSEQSFRSLFSIIAANWLFTLLSLGLYRPWAQIRLAKYRAERLTLIADGNLDDFIGERVEQERHAMGEEFADALDFDIAL